MLCACRRVIVVRARPLPSSPAAWCGRSCSRHIFFFACFPLEVPKGLFDPRATGHFVTVVRSCALVYGGCFGNSKEVPVLWCRHSWKLSIRDEAIPDTATSVDGRGNIDYADVLTLSH